MTRYWYPPNSYMKVKVLVVQLCPTLCNPMDWSLPGSSIHRILQAYIGVSIHSLLIQQWTGSKLGESECEVAQSCPTLCNPMDSNLPGSTVRGIFQARRLEWAAIWAVYCHPAYLTYMQTTSGEMPGWLKYKVESRFLGEILIMSYMQMTPLL